MPRRSGAVRERHPAETGGMAGGGSTTPFPVGHPLGRWSRSAGLPELAVLALFRLTWQFRIDFVFLVRTFSRSRGRVAARLPPSRSEQNC